MKIIICFFVFRNDIRSGPLEVSPSIGLVISQLKNTVEYYNREKHAYDGLLLQRNSLPSLSLDSKSNISNKKKKYISANGIILF